MVVSKPAGSSNPYSSCSTWKQCVTSPPQTPACLVLQAFPTTAIPLPLTRIGRDANQGGHQPLVQRQHALSAQHSEEAVRHACEWGPGASIGQVSAAGGACLCQRSRMALEQAHQTTMPTRETHPSTHRGSRGLAAPAAAASCLAGGSAPWPSCRHTRPTAGGVARSARHARLPAAACIDRWKIAALLSKGRCCGAGRVWQQGGQAGRHV